LTSSTNFYDILGISKNASEADIKSAFHKLARSKHPDKGTTAEEKASLQSEFELITKAYNTLKDPTSRAAYDAAQAKRGASAPAPVVESGANPTLTKSKAAGDPGAPSAPAPSAPMPTGPSSANLDKNRAQVAKRAFLKGLQHMQAGEYVKAAEFIESAIRNHDADPSYYFKLAQALRLGKRSFSKAESAAKKAIELDPYNSEYRLLLGQVYEDVGSTSRAIEVYEEVLKWDSTNDRALMALHSLKPPKKMGFLDRLFGKK
jgi:curved DNA-binding protein CbpA